MKTKAYKFYSDNGHGWLAVKRQELIDLGIIDKITPYSYQRGKTVYLEEDCDVDLFLRTKKAQGYTFKLSSYGTGTSLLAGSPDNKISFITKNCNGQSPIRSYESFKVANYV